MDLSTIQSKVLVAISIVLLTITTAFWSSLITFSADQTWVSMSWLQESAIRLWLPLWFLAIVINSHFLSGTRWQRLRRPVAYARLNITKFGSGFYGAVALIMFLNLELTRVLESVKEWQNIEVSFGSFFVEWLIRFGVDSFLNGIFSMVWVGLHD